MTTSKEYPIILEKQVGVKIAFPSAGFVGNILVQYIFVAVIMYTYVPRYAIPSSRRLQTIYVSYRGGYPSDV